MFTLPQGAPAKILGISQACIVRSNPTINVGISVFHRDLQMDRFTNPIFCQQTFIVPAVLCGVPIAYFYVIHYIDAFTLLFARGHV